MMKKIIIIIITIVVSFSVVSCETEPPKPENPIFSDVQKMEVEESGGRYYFLDLPDYIKYIQVLIFDNADTPAVDDNSKLITNISSLDGGNITGNPGITRSYVETFYNYTAGNFDTGTPIVLQTTDWFIVLGFDENMNLTHASPQYQESDL